MNELITILKGLAPTLATIVASPLGGAAVQAIAQKFGVENSVSAVATAIAGDPKAAEKLAELELEYAKLDVSDRASARERESAIATSASAPWYSKIVTPFLAVGVFFLWSVIQWHLVNHVVQTEMREMVIRLLGNLDAAMMLIFSYYFGKSHKH